MYRSYMSSMYLIRRYIRTLTSAKNANLYTRSNVDEAIKFYIILHNMLKIEDEFFDLVMMKESEVNKYLFLEDNYTVSAVMDKFYELFDRHSVVRRHTEELTSIEEVRNRLKDRPEIYTKLIL